MNRLFLKIGEMLLVVVILVSTCACGQSASSGNLPPATSGMETDRSEELFEFPEKCTLSESEMEEVLEEYVDCMSQSLVGSGITVTLKIQEDGSVHFNGKQGTVDIPDLKVYDSVKDTFAYLYNMGHVSIDGQLLIRAEDATEDMEIAESDAKADPTLGAEAAGE